MLIYYCKLKKTNPDHLKAFNYCLKSGCKMIKIFSDKNKLSIYKKRYDKINTR